MEADESPGQLAPLAVVVAAVLVLIVLVAAIVLLVLRNNGDDSPDLAPNEVARVDTVGPIAKRTFNHWYVIVSKSHQLRQRGESPPPPPATNSPRGQQLTKQVTEFLIAGSWLEGEAKERGVVVGDGEVLRLFRRTKRDSFAKPAAYRDFLRQSGQTQQDLRYRVRLQGLTAKVRADVTRGASDQQQQKQKLDAYQRDFKDQWRPRTHCAPGYLVPSCGNG